MMTLFALAVLGSVGGPFLLNQQHGPAVAFPTVTAASLISSAAPVLLAVTVIALVMRSVPARPHVPLIPPGDFIVLIEQLLDQIRRAARFGERVSPHYEWLNIVHLSDRIIAFETTKAWVDRVEARLETWKWVGFFFIVFILGFLGFLLL